MRLAKALLSALHLKSGASVEIELSPKKDAIIVRPARVTSRVRGRHRIEDLVAAMPKGYKASEFEWDASGRQAW